MIDVILCTYNSEKTIAGCIDSILGQTFSDFNLYIYDDCSHDSTVSIIKGYNDGRITIVKSDKNRGTYVGKNLLFRKFCNSDFVALHDSDDISFPTRFEKEKEFLESHPDAGAVGCAIREFWEDANIRPHTVCDSTGLMERVNCYPYRLNIDTLNSIVSLLKETDGYNRYLKCKFCMNGSVMFRRGVIEEVGGWDGMARVAGDTDIFVRILAKHNIYNLQEVLYSRRFHKDSLTASSCFGITSETRKRYNLSRLSVIEKASQGVVVRENFYVPQDLGFQIIGEKCAG